jgi:phosphatidylserine/phosphatidylglycerophosphate/cardiolipin synthase-like enzyme
LNDVVELLAVRVPQLHAKFLAWDDDDIVVSSMNWGSQSGLSSNRLDEIGLHLRGPGLAAALIAKFEAILIE